jgi:DNA-binding MarR family transcriptional regulator
MSSPCLCQTLRKAARRLSSAYDDALYPAGINLAQFSLLRYISRLQPLSLTELGRVVELDRSTIGRNIKVLEKQALTKEAPLVDQRETGVQLTEAGIRTLQQAEGLWTAVQTQFEQKLGTSEFHRLKDLLDTL